MTETGSPGRGWLRAAGLLGLTLALAPVSPVALVAAPLLLLGAAMGGWRGLVVAVPALLVFWGDGPHAGSWYLERGWSLLAGGWFLALTLARPSAGATGRGIGAVLGASASSALILAATPGGWSTVEWAARSRLEQGAAVSLELMRRLSGEEGTPEALEATLQGMVVEAPLYALPALLALATLASLSFGWWLVVRVATDRSDGIGPVGEFRFADSLVWVLIGGILLLLWGPEGWDRVGGNAVVFMAALYALRGVGVILGVRGGLSAPGWMLVLLGVIFAFPALFVGAFLLGLGDTWLDLRARTGGSPG